MAPARSNGGRGNEGDEVAISDEARALGQGSSGEARSASQTGEVGEGEAEDSPDGLSQDERTQVEKLKARDREVRAHEAAHQGAAGGLAGAASFTTQRGPDGRDYAIGGEVPINMAEGKTPEETIANAQRIRAAAMAPAQPSGADRSIAASASKMEAEARRELAETDSATGDDEATTGRASEAGEAETSAAAGEPKAGESERGEASASDGEGMRGGGVSGRHYHGSDCRSCAAQVARYRR
ncbi:MAG: putative metalloprotease CJM1_0395 family protein [Polyangiaceae bacterium]